MSQKKKIVIFEILKIEMNTPKNSYSNPSRLLTSL